MYTVTLNLTLVLLASLSFFPSLEVFFFLNYSKCPWGGGTPYH